MNLEYNHTINFFSDEINQIKIDFIRNKSLLINSFKNELSNWISQNILQFSKLSQFDFVKLKNTQINGLVGREIQNAISDVYIKYQNKLNTLNTLNSLIQFKIQDKIDYQFYKKNIKEHKIGDLKYFQVKLKSNNLSKVCTYLSKYYNPTLISYIKSQLNENIDDNKKEFYNLILFYINKFGDRLIQLCLNKRNRILENLFKIPINFNSLTYSAINTCKIINYNKNKKSKISYFISLTGFKNITEDGKLHIPIKFSKKYHKDINLFINKSKQVTYNISITKDNRIKISLTFLNTKEINVDDSETIGIDTNIKHNLFTLSNGLSFDFDRDLIKNYVKTKLKFDKKKKLNYVFSEKQEKRIIRWNRKIDGHYKSKVHELIELCKSNNINHLVCEDLFVKNKTFILSEEFCNIKYSRLINILHLNNFKNILESQCINNNFQLSVVPSHYTSQRCSCCGYIDANNRKTQEQFHCLECDYEDNADINAAKNIKFYKDSDVLNSKLLNQNEREWYIPKKLNKFKIRDILDSYYDSNIVKIQ